MSYAKQYLNETVRVIANLDVAAIEKILTLLVDLRARGGRLFLLGVGGSAANCSHAVNDFRKIAGIEAYTPLDNVSELTARINDEGWDSVFVNWLKGSRLRSTDMLFVFSVGGGSLEMNVSPNVVNALHYAKQIGVQVVGVVGRDGGYTAKVADAYVVVPTVNPHNVTPHAESLQAVVWHLLVSHPALKSMETHWESIETAHPHGRDRDGSLTRTVPIKAVEHLSVKIFADGADLSAIVEMSRKPYIKGFTTNPTLMRKAGITDYAGFAKKVLQAVPDKPISFEVFSDEFVEMERQARVIAGWGENVYVKIPVTNTRRESTCDLLRRLSHSGVKVNVTAILSLDQVRDVTNALAGGAPACVSVFAGRVADTGCDPVPLMAAALGMLRAAPNAELIWASPRELLNIFQADAIGCHIITVTNDLLAKLSLVGRHLDEYSLETVKMFFNDAAQADFAV